MVSWLIVLLIIVGVLAVVKFSHLKHFKHRHRLSIIAILLLVIFLASTIYLVSKNNHIDMTNVKGFYSGMQVYGSWLVNGFYNAKSLTGYAIGLNWSTANVNASNKVPVKKTTPTSGSNPVPSKVANKPKLMNVSK